VPGLKPRNEFVAVFATGSGCFGNLLLGEPGAQANLPEHREQSGKRNDVAFAAVGHGLTLLKSRVVGKRVSVVSA
jgi:hypothetical protein